MKKLLILSFISFVFFLEGYSQAPCKVLRDSIVSGPRATSYSVYEYSSSGLFRVTSYDSISPNDPSLQQIGLYNGNGNLTEVKTVDVIAQPPALKKTIKLEYTQTMPYRITRMTSTGFDSTGTNVDWKISHEINYSGSQISSIMLDQDSMFGNPDELPASLIDFVWTSGNISTLSLVLGPDTVEVQITTDNKINLSKKLFPDDLTWIFGSATANNIERVETVNNETVDGDFIPANTPIMDLEYTYYTNDEVRTVQENPSPLSNEPVRVTQYLFDCISAIGKSADVPAAILYPNPAANILHVPNAPQNSTIKIFDINGKQIMHQNIDATAVNISGLKSGYYTVEITNGKNSLRGNFLKE